MITLKKLASLPDGTKLRKIAALLRGMVNDMVYQRPVDMPFLRGLGSLLKEVPTLSPSLREEGALLASGKVSSESEALLRFCDGLYYRLSEFLGISPGDWDLREQKTGEYKKKGRWVLPLRVYLEDLRSPFNVGSIFRTAECFGAEKLFLSPGTPTPGHSRVQRTAMGAQDILPWAVLPLEELRGEEGLFVLELGGKPLADFAFPKEGTVILGSEELGVSPEAATLAEKGAGRVSIPLLGVKGSLNVSVAFGILIQAWSARLLLDS